MSSMRDIRNISENGCRNTDRSVSIWNFCIGKWSRRRVMALLLFLLLIIEKCRSESAFMTIASSLILGREGGVYFDAIDEWSVRELDYLLKVMRIITVIAQIPGAVVIFKFSSYKYLITATVISSILHMLTPIGLHHHSITLVILLLAESAISASVENAVLSMWKYWAPPLERTMLITICFLATFVNAVTITYHRFIYSYFYKEDHFYITGIAGLVWALFWFCSTSNFPENDPLISEKELGYLKDTIPTANYMKIRLRNIPWKSILTSKQMYILCLVFFKMAYSVSTIYFGTLFFQIHISFSFDLLWIFIIFSIALILVPLCSAKLAEILIQKSESNARSVRIKFIGTGFLLQCLLLLGTLIPLDIAKGIFFLLASICFAASLPGFITMPLDMSPRYVSILLGFIWTAYNAGSMCFEYFAENVVNMMHVDSIGPILLLDGAISVACVILLYRYADYNEQPWSAIPGASNCYANPVQENEDVHDEV